MNTSNIKKYAPQARAEFITAVSKRLNLFGIYVSKTADENARISDVSIDGSVMQVDGNSFDASLAESRKKLVEQTKKQGFNQFVEHTAYTWFNRLCAIRYMELHDYLEHGLRILSPSPTQGEGWGEGKLPEILDHAQDVAQDLGLNRDHIIELKLAGNQDEQLYRELLIGQCHQLHQAMPFLFEALDDATELLLPDNLTRTDSLLRGLVNDIPEEDWQQVEIIGWLYQFYISEKKDEVIGKVVKSEDIPAATQLFTPNWIVKYLVQNSVGRQWLQTYPDSSIKSEMEYYIEPAKQTETVGAALAANTPDSIDPETIKVLDPACGSGHILVEAYQVLKSIYEERGYRSRDIPKLILENNLYGLDIDDRAAQLAGFALMMLARADDRRIFSRDVKLNVVSLQETANTELNQLWREVEITDNVSYQMVQDIWKRFEQAKTFGSLIDIPAKYEPALKALLNSLTEIEQTGSFLQRPVAQDLKPIIQQAWLLSQRYDAVVANPPYMGGKGMNAELKKFAKECYPNSKSDLFAMFMQGAFKLCDRAGFVSQVTMQSWMFLTTFQSLREWLLNNSNIVTMAHLGPAGFDGLSKFIVQTTCFVLKKDRLNAYDSTFDRLVRYHNSEDKRLALIAGQDRFNSVKVNKFERIPGNPIAYWLSDNYYKLFEDNPKLSELAFLREGMTTSNNERFLRLWYEVQNSKIRLHIQSREESIQSGGKWFPYNKGGGARNWYGNNEYVVNWENDGDEVCRYNAAIHGSATRQIRNMSMYFKPSLTWSAISATGLAIRVCSEGFIFDSKGPSIFCDGIDLDFLHGLLGSCIADYILSGLKATLDYRIAQVGAIPVANVSIEEKNTVIRLAKECQLLSKDDWDSQETSWDFSVIDLLKSDPESSKIKKISIRYDELLCFKKEFINNFASMQERLNVFVTDIYRLHNEVDTAVSLEDLVLLRNIADSKQSEYKLLTNDRSNVFVELISYVIGCMMGRYSLDREGLVYAHAGNEGFDELDQQGSYNTFPADDDGIIPLTDQEWFEDDVTLRFREFVQTVWGSENLQANLDFVAESLCLHAIKPKSNETSLDTIRRYLSTQFYKDHLKTYKKRPIYWLFSSGKQKAFECLVYLHRYNAGTLARMRTEYVTPLLGKYDAYADTLSNQIDQASSTAEANRLSKSLTALEKKQTELREFDDKLKHHADMQIALDLDDGVKVNYGKFGDLLSDVKSIAGKK